MEDYPVVSVDPAVDAEIQPWHQMVRTVYQDTRPPAPEWLDSRRKTLAGQRLRAAKDGDRVVGTFRSWEAGLTVPGGGSVTATLVSSVAVRQTHRRRGILTSLITPDLAGSKERGVPVSILIGAEGAIYGRYGYGPATDSVTWTVDATLARLHPAAEALAAQLVLEDIVPDEELRPLCPPLFEATRLPGEIDRLESWWDVALALVPGPHPQERPGLNVVARDPSGAVEGILRYFVKESWVDRMPRSEITLDLLLAATPRAYAALWKYLVDQDTLATIKGEDLSVEEPLPQLLADPRAAKMSNRCDLLQTRVLDPVALLAARTYASPGAAVIEVVDDRGWATGRFALEAAADGTATCERTDAAADVVLPVATLGAAWLGGADLHPYAVAGLAEEGRTGGVARASALLRTPTPPYCGTWF